MAWDKDFVNRNGGKLKNFLVNAFRQGYGSGNNPEEMSDGARIFAYEQGDWKYEDIYYGGEPYGGITTIYYLGRACWVMTYFGRVMPKAKKDSVYACLGEALMHFSSAMPIRGPKSFDSKESGLTYRNARNGDLKFYHGREEICDKNGKLVYEMNYHGGFVDLR
ncbi:hypothetical protein IJF85_02105 [Candidatus Saccharibacteria bacterium]|nr:hypothetical protein [Candidatus Saccharibacteria bacterium]